MSTLPNPPAKKQRRFSRRTIILGIIALLFACGLIGTLLTQGTDTVDVSLTADSATAAAFLDREPTPEPADDDPPAEPTAAPAAANLSPADSLRAAVANALGTSNRDVERLVSVEDVNGRIEVDWAINDNITENLNRAAAQMDATDILRAIAQSGYDFEFVLMRGTFPLVDQFGTVEESKVVELFFERPTVDRINWDNFLHANIYDIADSAEIHPAFVRE